MEERESQDAAREGSRLRVGARWDAMARGAEVRLDGRRDDLSALCCGPNDGWLAGMRANTQRQPVGPAGCHRASRSAAFPAPALLTTRLSPLLAIELSERAWARVRVRRCRPTR